MRSKNILWPFYRLKFILTNTIEAFSKYTACEWPTDLPASFDSKLNVHGRPGKPFLRPFPLATTLVASPWKCFVLAAPGFFSTASTYRLDTCVNSDFACPLPARNTHDMACLWIWYNDSRHHGKYEKKLANCVSHCKRC